MSTEQLQIGMELGPRVDLLEADTCQDKWRVSPGEVFRVRGVTGIEHVIACGDSRSVRFVLALHEQVSASSWLWVTDPPYGIGYSQRTSPRRNGQGKSPLPPRRKDRDFDGRDDVLDARWLPLWAELAPPHAIYLFTLWKVLERWRQAMVEVGCRPQQRIVWDKMHFGMGDVSRYGSQLEDILCWYAQGRTPTWEKREGNLWTAPVGVHRRGRRRAGGARDAEAGRGARGGRAGAGGDAPQGLVRRLIDRAGPRHYIVHMSNWLDSIPLSPEQRAKLSALDLDIAAAVAALTLEQLMEATGFTIGKASLVMAAAKDALPKASAPPTPAAPTTISVQIAEPPDLATRRAKALEAAAADQTRLAALVDLGIPRVVVGTAEEPESDAINLAATRAMLAHAAAGAEVGTTWAGLRIVDVAEVTAPRIFCNPRTGAALQEGKDAMSLVPWAELGIEGLRLAAYGYERGLFEGRAEDWVFAAVRDDKGWKQRIRVMAKADGFDLAGMDERLVWRPRARESQPAGSKQGTGSGSPQTGNPWAKLNKIFLDRFDTNELLRFVRFNIDGKLINDLPDAQTPKATIVHKLVELLRARGYIDAELRRNLIAERPRSADEINAAFDALGV